LSSGFCETLITDSVN